MVMKEKMGLDKKTCDEICGRLSHFMADSFVVYMKTLNFHWNMVGDRFFMFHKLLEEQYEEVSEGIDQLAERIRMLGQPSPGTLSEILNLSCIKEANKKLSQEKMIEELAKDNTTLVEHCRQIIDFTDEKEDQGSSDLLVDRMRAHDKNAWILRSHIERRK